MTKGLKSVVWAAVAALILFGAAMNGRASADILFKRAALAIETKAGPVHLDVEVADTDPKREQGLMFRRELSAGQGMIFLFDADREISMWMKNTYISLDMVFIGEDWRITHIAKRTEPLSTDIISSQGRASRVLEIGGGQAEMLGLKAGDAVSLQN